VGADEDDGSELFTNQVMGEFPKPTTGRSVFQRRAVGGTAGWRVAMRCKSAFREVWSSLRERRAPRQ